MSDAIVPLPEPQSEAKLHGSPLDCLPDEPPLAYEAFLSFIAARKGKRTVKDIAKELGGSEHTFAEWCTKYHWRARRRAYFSVLAKKRFQAEVQAVLTEAANTRGTEAQIADLMGRLVESSGDLLEHLLAHHSQDFKIGDVLHMIRSADQLGRTKRAKPPEATHQNSELRKELMGVIEYVKEQRKLRAEQAKTQAPQTAEVSMTLNSQQSSINSSSAAGSMPPNSSSPEGSTPTNPPQSNQQAAA